MVCFYWDDAYPIAQALRAAYPGVDPLSVDWDTLHRWVVALPGFADDPRLKDPVRLEEIQREWLEEVLAHG